MGIYYAHSKKIYGTDQEREELAFLESIFDDVVCPNRDMGELGVMEPYLQKVDECRIVVCSEFKGHVGNGVASEVVRAIANEHPAYCLRNKRLYRVGGIKVVDNGDWSVKYGKVRLVSELEDDWS